MIPEIEKKSRIQIKQFQEEKLHELMIYLNHKSPFYIRLFKNRGIDISNIKTVEDLIKIPVTTKEDLQKYNDDFICVNRSKIIDYVTTSGTTGKPVFFGLTDNDLERLAYNEAISFACSKVTKNDTIQLMTTIDRRFMAGLAYFLGARKMGAGIIRVGAGIPELQWDSIIKFKPTYLIAVPSFLLKLIEYADNNGIDIKPIAPIIAIMMAPRKALPKPLTSKLGTRAAASIIISAFITSANRPNVNTDNGAVKNHSAGRINAFIRPSTVAAIIKAKRFFVLIPETNNVAKPRPIAVANQAINNASTVYSSRLMWLVSERMDFAFYQQKILRQVHF